MNKVTEIIIKDIHPKWKVLLGTPIRTGELLIDVLDRTVTQVLSLDGKLCPDHPSKVLRCLQLDPDKIKVVIIGGDVYIQPGIATGLAFASEKELQPSLNVLLQELRNEYQGIDIDSFNTNLEQWESQGVLLLNASFTCEQFKLGSHSKLWEDFFAGLLTILNDLKLTRPEMTSLVFVFIGDQAKMFQTNVSEKLNYKIMRHHPTAETFGGSKFTGFYNEVNKCLEESGQTIIQWHDSI